jgi:glycosyltransferase involved in cell wall biosynthesis
MSYLAGDKNVRPIVVPELGREISFAKDITALFKLYAIMKREMPDIVHTHTAKAGTLGRIAAALSGVPIKVHTFHGHIFDGYFSPFKARIFLMIERFMALFTDKVIIVTESVKDEMVRRLKIAGEERCAVIPLGLELDKFLNCGAKRGIFKKRLKLDDETLLVGIIGRLVPIKNHRMFLGAAREAKRRLAGKKVKFIVAGDGELKAGLTALASEMNMADDVIFTGWVRDLTEVYADLDIVALTSLNEGTPVSLIEAMAAARPVIATDVGGVRDLVKDGETGILAKSGDIDDFSGKLVILLKDGVKRKALGERASADVIKRYSKERLISDLKSLYEKQFLRLEGRTRP